MAVIKDISVLELFYKMMKKLIFIWIWEFCTKKQGEDRVLFETKKCLKFDFEVQIFLFNKKIRQNFKIMFY